MLQSEIERKKLEAKTVDELRKICKEKGISYYESSKRLTKGRIIDKLLLLDVMGNNNGDNNEELVKNPVEKSNNKVKRVKTVVKKKPFELSDETINEVEEAERLERKKKYVEQANIGTIVAFKLPTGKVISAAITRKSTKGRKFMVETNYGAEHKISFDDVLWVRTNKRWPKGIYLLFKRNVKTEVSKDGEEIG